MDGKKRRIGILHQLEVSETPISASSFAKEFKVSRQIVVGDVALLRASGQEIIATARGYLLEKDNQKGILSKIACQHMPEQTEEELSTIVSLGGEVIDVIVEHPLYGELTGNLHIRTMEDVQLFMQSYKKNKASLLSALTGGIHLHTIRCKDIETIEKIKNALAEQEILYAN